MFKLTVEQVLASIEAFTPEEKLELQKQLPRVLSGSSIPATPASGQNQVNTVSGVNSDGSFSFAPIQAGGSVTSSQNINQNLTENSELKEVLNLLAQLKHNIHQSEDLNPLLKTGAKEQVEKLEKELKKPKPDTGLVKQTIDTLKQGLEGVVTLAEPTMKVASLVAKAWGIAIL